MPMDEAFVVKEFELLIEELGPIVYISTLCGQFIQRNGISVTSIIKAKPLDLFKRYSKVFVIVSAGNVTLKKYEYEEDVLKVLDKPHSKAYRKHLAAKYACSDDLPVPNPEDLIENDVIEEFRRLILGDQLDSVYQIQAFTESTRSSWSLQLHSMTEKVDLKTTSLPESSTQDVKSHGIVGTASYQKIRELAASKQEGTSNQRFESKATTASDSRQSSPASSNHSESFQTHEPGLERQALREAAVKKRAGYAGQFQSGMEMPQIGIVLPYYQWPYPMVDMFGTQAHWPQPLGMLAPTDVSKLVNSQAHWPQPLGMLAPVDESKLVDSKANTGGNNNSQRRFRKENGDKKKTNLKKLNPAPSESSDYSGITTLMIRGIPCSFTQEDLLNLIASADLMEHCNFFYLPTEGKSKSNLGYAFLNFTETLYAWTCAFTFNGLQLDPARSSKICSVSAADIQGIENLRQHFRRTFVNRSPRGPLFLGDKRNHVSKGLRQKEERKDAGEKKNGKKTCPKSFKQTKSQEDSSLKRQLFESPRRITGNYAKSSLYSLRGIITNYGTPHGRLRQKA